MLVPEEKFSNKRSWKKKQKQVANGKYLLVAAVLWLSNTTSNPSPPARSIPVENRNSIWSQVSNNRKTERFPLQKEETRTYLGFRNNLNEVNRQREWGKPWEWWKRRSNWKQEVQRDRGRRRFRRKAEGAASERLMVPFGASGASNWDETLAPLKRMKIEEIGGEDEAVATKRKQLSAIFLS